MTKSEKVVGIVVQVVGSGPWGESSQVLVNRFLSWPHLFLVNAEGRTVWDESWGNQDRLRNTSTKRIY